MLPWKRGRESVLPWERVGKACSPGRGVRKACSPERGVGKVCSPGRGNACFPRLLSRKKQCCGSGMFIPDPKTATKEMGEKKLVVIPFFIAINLTNCKLFYF
jgi:hypothetical protein